MSEKFSRSPVHEYRIVSKLQFEPVRVMPALTEQEIQSIAREIIALSSWSDAGAE